MSERLNLVLRQAGLCAYLPVWRAMQDFTRTRHQATADEIWSLQHQPVFTVGRAGKDIYLGDTGAIPVVRTDRGGQVTYHGPGQLTQYLLLDTRRLNLGVRQLVDLIQDSIIALLDGWQIESEARSDAPGVYVRGSKIASLGLRISRGCSYHGLALNVDMDMAPWQRINACGLGVPVTRLSDWLNPCPSVDQVASALTREIAGRLGYNLPSHVEPLP